MASEATAAARWLLDSAADGGVALTQTKALARAVVRDAAQRWPEWWDADLFGPPHREADVAILEALDEGLRRLRLLRRRGRRLHATVKGRELAADPLALLRVLAADLGGGDPFTEMVAEQVLDRLAAGEDCEHSDLVVPALAAARRGGWHDGAGNQPDEPALSWPVSDVLRRGQAYGLIDRYRAPEDKRRWRTLISLKPAAHLVFVPTIHHDVADDEVFVFDAALDGHRGVGARLAVGAHEHLTALHDAIQEAFGWADDHLYSFWLDGDYWGDQEMEFGRPGVSDNECRTTDVPLVELNLAVGARIAYVFDYGDEWRVMLTLCDRRDGSQGMLRVLERRGRPPTQYAPIEDG
ncbi:MAG: hypothetical protein JOZ07_07505 [Solirubrobacterales bacterium]|nr:hypothetical protein [Solirubrobacterales bacterium]